jgi:holin-like protein
MRYLLQFFLIIAVTCVGEAVRIFVPLPIPGSIYGMCLLFALLSFHVIPVAMVQDAGSFLVQIMSVLFIPAAVGLVDVWPVLRTKVLPYCVIIIVSTVAVFLVSGTVSQHLLEKRGKREEQGK